MPRLPAGSAAERCQPAAATASAMRDVASAAPEKNTDVPVTQYGPLKACTIPWPPLVEKYASSPSPPTEAPALAAPFTESNALGPGCEIVMSMASPLVWLIQRQATPLSVTAFAARLPESGVKLASRPKLGLKSYMVCALTTLSHGIDTGVGASSGTAVSLGMLDGVELGEGELLLLGSTGGAGSG